MTDTRRAFLREVMETAWYAFRHRALPGSNVRTFADALRNAWAVVKRRALPPVLGPTLHLRSMLQSPIRRSLRGQPYADTRARSLGYVTSMVGG